MQGAGYRVQGTGHRAQGTGYRVRVTGYRGAILGGAAARLFRRFGGAPSFAATRFLCGVGPRGGGQLLRAARRLDGVLSLPAADVDSGVQKLAPSGKIPGEIDCTKDKIGGMKMLLAGLVLLGAGISRAQTAETHQPKRLYIEERVRQVTGSSVHCDSYGNCYGHQGTNTRNVSLEVTREVMRRCPEVLTVTDNREAADFDLRISPGSSTLYRQNGDVAYVSPTRFRVSNLAKDVCNFVAEQH